MQRNGNAILSFATSLEINNHGFEILRKTENGRFSRIKFIKSKGNTNSISQYNYEDKGLKEGITYYYQLVQHDLNGTKTNLGIRSVKISNQAYVVSEFYFDTTQNTAKISIDSINQTTAVVTIFSITGAKVYSKNHALKEGVQAINISLSTLSKGIYTCNINIDGETFVRKLHFR